MVKATQVWLVKIHIMNWDEPFPYFFKREFEQPPSETDVERTVLLALEKEPHEGREIVAKIETYFKIAHSAPEQG